MKKHLALIFVVAAMLSACSDGVPNVADPHNPTDADGNPIKAYLFIKKYCEGKVTSETCAKVIQAHRTDSTKGGLPKGW